MSEDINIKSAFLTELIARGYLNACSDLQSLDQRLLAGQVTGYVGFDCTAPSLHVGNLLHLMVVRLFYKHGNLPIVLLGGGTTRVGDPSGKDSMRKVLQYQEIESNIDNIGAFIHKFLFSEFNGAQANSAQYTMDSPQGGAEMRAGGLRIVNNAEWLLNINYIEFLRDYGASFSVNRLLSLESIKNRLEREQHLSFLEFNYPLLQAYDFIELKRRWNCVLQFGGSDQWGNIISGIDLGHRVLGEQLYAITTPLITTSSGVKMGKTAEGAVWVNEQYLSPYEYWQFWRNTEDADVVRFLKLYTDLPLEKIDELAQLQGRDINEVKVILAHEATRLCHGEMAALAAREAAEQIFGTGGGGDAINLNKLPHLYLDFADLADEDRLLYKIIVRGGGADSGKQARSLLKSGAVRLGDKVIDEEFYKLKLEDFFEKTDFIEVIQENERVEGEKNEKNSFSPANVEKFYIKLALGKKKHILLLLQE